MIGKHCRRRKRKSRFFGGILAVLLLALAVLPFAAFAVEQPPAEETQEETPYTDSVEDPPVTGDDKIPSAGDFLPAGDLPPAGANKTATPPAGAAPSPEKTELQQALPRESPAAESIIRNAAPVENTSQPCGFLNKIDLSYIEPKDPPYPKNATVTLKYGYMIPQGIVTNTEYVFSAPEVFVFSESFTVDLKDQGKKVGEARVSGADNRIALVFFDAEFTMPGSTGELWITAKFDPGKIDNAGTQPIEFLNGNGGLLETVEVPFLIDQIEGSVRVTEEGAADLANMKINWEATLSPALKNVASADKDKAEGKIGSLVFTAKIEDGQEFDASMLSGCSVVEKGGGTVAGASFSYDGASRTLSCIFTAPVENGVQYVVRYPTKITVASFGGANSKTFHNAAQVSYDIPQYDVNKTAPEFAARKVDNNAAEASVSADMIMLGKEESLSGRVITWTVKINGSGLPVDNAMVTDTLPAGLRILSAPVLTGADGNPAAASVTYNTPTEADFTVDSVSGITVDFGAGPLRQACTLVYQTKIHDDFYQRNDIAPFRNQAAFTGAVGGIGINYEKYAEARVNTHLVTKSGKYNTQDHTISWVVGLNGNRTDMRGITLKDTIPEGLTLDEASIRIGGLAPSAGAVGYDTGSRLLTITPADMNGAGQEVTYQTLVDDEAIWANNTAPTKLFNNTARLEATVDGKTVTAEASYNPEVASEVIRCEARQDDYNFADKLAKWKLTVNKNQMEITDGVIEVNIPAGQRFSAFCNGLPDGYSYAVTDSGEGASCLRIVLPPVVAKGSAPIEMEYLTEITDLEAFNENPKVNIENTATLSGAEMPAGGVKADCGQTVASSVVKKTGGIKQGVTNVITWKVLVNENLVPMTAPAISDPLMEGLVLDPGSVKLYRLGVTGGKADEGKAEEIPVWDGAVEYDRETGLFLFHFGTDISDAYMLVFDTHIDCHKTGMGTKDFTNSASIMGGAVQQQGTPARVGAFVFDDGGIANKFSGSVKILKMDENGNPLMGAQFRLNNIVKTTDENGEAIFDKLLPGSYAAKEIAAPENCVAAPAETPEALKDIVINAGETAPVEIRVENTLIKSALGITKTDEAGTAIGGVAFRVRSMPGTPEYDRSLATGKDGKVLFEDLLYGTYTYEEVSAPQQYEADKKPVAFAVTRDDHGKTIERRVENRLRPAPSEEPPAPPSAPAPPSVPPEVKAESSAPRTGDAKEFLPFLLLAGTAGMAAAAGISLAIKRKDINL